MEERLCSRRDVPVELTWDLSLLFKDNEEYELSIQRMQEMYTQLGDYKGRLANQENILSCLQLYNEFCALKASISSYSELALSVDYTDNDNLEREARVSSLLNQMAAGLSFIDNELCKCSIPTLEECIKHASGTAGYLRNILRKKAHILHPEAERVLSAFGEIMSAPYSFYEQSKLSDMRFESFTIDSKSYPLDYSLFEDSYEYDSNTAVRHAAFHAFSATLHKYENLTACAYNTEVRRQKVESELRGYSSVFDFLLSDQHVTREMYDRQIDLIMSRLSVHMRRYADLIAEAHHISHMTYADLKAPIDPDFPESYTLADARDQITGALSILGPDYIETVNAAFEQRWIDMARNEGKSTGGFCDSPYGKNSFILMTWNGRMSDIFTLAHELGHAGHFAACNKSQSYFDTDVSTYFVEAPSTMNELILGHFLLSGTSDKRLRRYILSRMIGDTYYHNCVTHLIEAAYQREVYRIIDAGGSVHAPVLNRIMGDTLRKFWGDHVEINEDAELTWMRQPHYYMGLYSYTYSAGLTVATQVCDRIRKEGQPAVEDWKRVLAAGSTLDPAELSALVGVDITTDRALIDTIDMIGAMIDEIEQLTREINDEKRA